MATFSKRNGRVTATVRIKPHPSQSKTFDTLRDAKSWAKETEVRLKNEKVGDFNHLTFAEALIEYRDNVSVNKKGSDKEVSRISYFLDHMDVNISIEKVDTKMLIEWREMRLEIVKPATVRREMIVLAAFLTWCLETKMWIKNNPMASVKLPAASNHRERIISEAEIEEIKKHLDNETISIFLLALETGMRLQHCTR